MAALDSITINPEPNSEATVNEYTISIAFLKHKMDQFLVYPGVYGNSYSAVINEIYPDRTLPVESIVRDVALQHNMQYYGAEIVPANIEKWMWNRPVGSRFVVNLSNNWLRIKLENVYEIASRDAPEEYEKSFEILKQVEADGITADKFYVKNSRERPRICGHAYLHQSFLNRKKVYGKIYKSTTSKNDSLKD
ncbi:uncharacterized protein LOC134223293 [Armigeres subalbatus]|uniref:uncharacterized protein LOC134223293 n=1 Tax=Armigeres subalbatus TaxID=124917 RepID=UPI002ED34E08